MARTKDARKVGKMLRQMREEAELSQVEVAGKLGKRQSWVSKLEIGMQPVLFEDLVMLCDLYGCRLSDATRRIEAALRG